MTRLMEKFERLMMAVTFAEAGEHDTSKQILNQTSDSAEGIVVSSALEAQR